MKILLAVDGSEHSNAAVQELLRRPWPAGTEVLVVSVAHPWPDVQDPFMMGIACHIDSEKLENERANKVAAAVAELVKRGSPFLKVSTHVSQGSPKQEIVAEAERWQADLVLMGSHGHGPIGRFLLGSVPTSVALHAPCSVEIVRAART